MSSISFAPKSRLGRFEMVRPLGRGGAGVVYLAKDTLLDIPVALKFLEGSPTAGEGFERFRREVLLARQISHPGICRLFDLHRDDDHLFISMEYVRGPTLSSLLRSGDPLPPADAVGVVRGICQAVAAAHQMDIIHRDLKPLNIIVRDANHISVLDFGIAMAATMARITSSGIRVGTLRYMPPEVILGDRPTPQSDIYSTGIILYECLAGQGPFDASSLMELQAAITAGRVVPLRARAPGLQAALEEIVSTALARSPVDRFPSMEAFDEALAGANMMGDGAAQRSTSLADRLQSPERRPGSAAPTEVLQTHQLSPSVPSDDVVEATVQLARATSGAGTGSAPARRFLLPIAALLLLAAVGVIALLREPDSANVVERTLLVVPLEVFGQDDGADYLGYAFAQAIAVNLAPVKGLRVLPVPQASELEGTSARAHARTALSLGASQLLLGSLTRQDDRFHASVTMVDPVDSRTLWGTKKEGSDTEILGLAAQFSREIANHLGLAVAELYPYITDLTGDEAMALRPETAQALGALRRGEVELALQATAALVELLPEHAEVLALRAHALVLQWDAEPSAANLESLHDTVRHLDKTPLRHPYADFYRAYVALREGQPGQAANSLDEVIERDGLAPAARAWMLRYRAEARRQLGESEAALTDLSESLRLDPTNAWTLTILSGTLVDVGRREEGISRARQGLALVPSYWRNHMALAYALSSLERHQEASAEYGRACELGRSQLPCSLLALELIKASRDAEARQAAEQAVTLFATAWGSYNLACYWALAGDEESALRLLRQGVELGLSDRVIADDPDLRSLHGNASYEALKAEVLTRLPR